MQQSLFADAPAVQPSASKLCAMPECDAPSVTGHYRYCAEHKGGIKRDGETKLCRHPGCLKPRRRKQAAVYCDDHATMIDGVIGSQRIVTTPCLGCGRAFPHKRASRVTAADAWESFCPNCRRATPLTLLQLQAHRVPYDQTVAWLRQGADLGCGICGQGRGHGKRRLVIDHDHACCRGGSSCGRCIRGILCHHHNQQVGHVEGLARVGLLDAVIAYAQGTGVGRGLSPATPPPPHPPATLAVVPSPLAAAQ